MKIQGPIDSNAGSGRQFSNAACAFVLQFGWTSLKFLLPLVCVLCSLVCVLCSLVAAEHPDFSGTWKLAGDATLRIEHHDPELVVETLNKGKRALQRYTTDGRETMSTAIDGAEIHTQVLWRRGTLLLAMEEFKHGKTIKSTETWSLLEGGMKLKRERVTAKLPQGRTLIYSK